METEIKALAAFHRKQLGIDLDREYRPTDELIPAISGVGEIWVDAQFERVPGQLDRNNVEKPGTIVVVDAASFRVEREIDGLQANGRWNNPHNMWADFALDHVYNSNWFGKSINKIDRISGEILSSIDVGEAPTHIITIPTPKTNQLGMLMTVQMRPSSGRFYWPTKVVERE